MPGRKKQSTPDEKSQATGSANTQPSEEAKTLTTEKKSTEKKSTAKPAAKKGRASTKEKTTQSLVIVESPAKAKTINKYLGPNFRVLASYGHIRDLPERGKRGEVVAGIDVATWTPTYIVHEPKGKSKGRRTPKEILAELKKEAKKSERIYLATDPDREGEAIAWHLEDELGLDDATTFRIAFNEITRTAVQNAIDHPGKIEMDRVRAQEARRMLDRVVGYPLSKLLSKKVVPGLSAGRVQSVALKLVVDREREIQAFKPEEYWKINALLSPTGTLSIPRTDLEILHATPKGESEEDETIEKTKTDKKKKSDIPDGAFRAELAEWAGKKFAAKNETDTTTIAGVLDTADYAVTKIEQKDRKDNPSPPFKTSTLQQQASLRLRFTANRTMQVAQKLYEGVELTGEGSVALITYMRTDSFRISKEATDAVRSHIESAHGKTYLPDKPNTYASGKSAQEAHEAIRPTDVSYTPGRAKSLGLAGDQLKLYTLIYERFVASQMVPAIFAVTNVEVTATPKDPSEVGLFKAQGKILKFDGYRKVYSPSKDEDNILPPLKEKDVLDRHALRATQHFTQPPHRYNEASLVKVLEDRGIGRPSTYAAIMNKITSDTRGYIEVKERRFYATDLGMKVTDLLVDHFPHVMDIEFTKKMEVDLDEIENAKTEYHEVLNEFWGPFSTALTTAETEMPSIRNAETGEDCPECGAPLISKYSKKTKREFVGCSAYKEGCKYIKPGEGEPERPKPIETKHKCPTCGKMMLQIEGEKGQYLACSDRECKTRMRYDEQGNTVVTAQVTEHKCEKCEKPMMLREGPSGMFLGCSGYPTCRFTMPVDAEGNPIKPVGTEIACEKCGSPMRVRRGPRGLFLGCSAYPKCRSSKPIPDEMKEELKDKMPEVAKPKVPEVEVKETCPECGSEMKLRAGRRGSFFLGCSAYPKCKGSREATPEILEQVEAAKVSS